MSRIVSYLPHMAWLLWPVSVAVMSRTGRICRTAWLFWPVSVAVMSRIGRYLLYEVAALARIGDRHDPDWPLFAV